MTYEEARTKAIAAGALAPQGFKEGIAANLLSYYEGRSFATTPRAQSRLEAWTNAILNGAEPGNLK